jgi:hypothetical protein
VFVSLIKRKRKFEISQNSLSQILDLTRAFRKTYGHLHAEDYVDNKAAILVRVGEKFAAENKLLRKENEGLRGALFEEKLKRKGGKALNFYEEGEKQGQALFLALQRLLARKLQERLKRRQKKHRKLVKQGSERLKLKRSVQSARKPKNQVLRMLKLVRKDQLMMM